MARRTCNWFDHVVVLIVSKFARSVQIAGRARVSPRSEPGGKSAGTVRYQAIMSSTVAASGRTSPRLSTTAFIACMCSPMRFRPARRSAMTSPCAKAVPWGPCPARVAAPSARAIKEIASPHLVSVGDGCDHGTPAPPPDKSARPGASRALGSPPSLECPDAFSDPFRCRVLRRPPGLRSRPCRGGTRGWAPPSPRRE